MLSDSIKLTLKNLISADKVDARLDLLEETSAYLLFLFPITDVPEFQQFAKQVSSLESIAIEKNIRIMIIFGEKHGNVKVCCERAGITKHLAFSDQNLDVFKVLSLIKKKSLFNKEEDLAVAGAFFLDSNFDVITNFSNYISMLSSKEEFGSYVTSLISSFEINKTEENIKAKLFNESLLEILVCPMTGCRLRYNKEKGMLFSSEAQVYYPITEGIPVLLSSAAIKTTEDHIDS